MSEPETGTAAALNRLADAIGQLNDRAVHRERVIDRLHEENRSLREGIREAILAPVVADLIRLYDGLHEHSARLATGDEQPAGALLASFADDVALALDRCGVEVVQVDPDSPFDPQQHIVVSIVDTEDASRDAKLAQVLGAAMRDRASGRIRRPARVRVYRHQAEPRQAEPRQAEPRQAEQSLEPITRPVEETL